MDAAGIRRCVAAILMCEFIEGEEPKRKRATIGDWLKRSKERGAFVNTDRELGVEVSGGYKEMWSMNDCSVCTILNCIERDITPRELVSGIAFIRAPERLVLCVSYFAKGGTFLSLSFQFRISISSIVLKVSKAINYISLPQNEAVWLNISSGFESQWNFPNAIVTHMVIKPPRMLGQKL